MTAQLLSQTGSHCPTKLSTPKRPMPRFVSKEKETGAESALNKSTFERLTDSVNEVVVGLILSMIN